MRPALRERGLRRRRARLPQRALPARAFLIALLGDTHLPRGSRRLPDACVELVGRADLVLHTGDVTTRAALVELEALGPPVLAVHGNVDTAELRELLPERRVVEADGLRIGLVHDAGPAPGRLERLLTWFPGCDLVAYGHTHQPEATKVEDVWVVNPGSPTERRRAPARTMATISSRLPRLVTLP